MDTWDWRILGIIAAMAIGLLVLYFPSNLSFNGRASTTILTTTIAPPIHTSPCTTISTSINPSSLIHPVIISTTSTTTTIPAYLKQMNISLSTFPASNKTVIGYVYWLSPNANIYLNVSDVVLNAPPGTKVAIINGVPVWSKGTSSAYIASESAAFQMQNLTILPYPNHQHIPEGAYSAAITIGWSSNAIPKV